MTQHPDDFVVWSVNHRELDLCIFGVSRRKLALVKATGLAAAHGFMPHGWKTHSTITLPRGRPDVSREAQRSIERRAEVGYPAFYHNDRSLHRQVFGRLIMLRMSPDDTAKVMQGIRTDLKQFIAAKAVA